MDDESDSAGGEVETTETDGGEDKVIATARAIDDFFASAAREQATTYPPEAAATIEEILRAFDQFTAVAFVDAYRDGNIYPEERLYELLMRFTDVRLQEWYIHFDAGITNEHYYAPLHVNQSLANSARLKLTLMATTQSIIGRSRIAWEKLMRAIYYLETGSDLEPSAKRSYKAKFFAWVSEQPKWRFLEVYQPIVATHDDRFRNGEFHKGSVLRRAIFGHEMPDLNEIMNLSNHMTNGIWPNILEIVQGRWPNQFSELHSASGERFEIDSRYLQPKAAQEDT